MFIFLSIDNERKYCCQIQKKLKGFFSGFILRSHFLGQHTHTSYPSVSHNGHHEGLLKHLLISLVTMALFYLICSVEA